MWYVIIGRDSPNSLDKRRAQRAAHVERLTALREAGRVLVAGPMPAIDASDPGPAGFVGSVIIAEFDSQASARAWVDADPYVAAGVWGEVQVEPFVRVA
jgi:uncharacterized protein YciI